MDEWHAVEENHDGLEYFDWKGKNMITIWH